MNWFKKEKKEIEAKKEVDFDNQNDGHPLIDVYGTEAKCLHGYVCEEYRADYMNGYEGYVYYKQKPEFNSLSELFDAIDRRFVYSASHTIGKKVEYTTYLETKMGRIEY